MSKKFFLTGGAGFIGSNYVRRLILRGEDVTILDNLSRKGSNANLDWLKKETGKNSFELIKGDVRDFELLRKSLKKPDVIVHLASQVAVTTSVVNPIEDFEINAHGTLNVLEAARLSGNFPIVVYASTNKVYGGLEDLRIIEEDTRYKFQDKIDGIDENRNLDFHSPYGCSKGCGDQYTRDYHRIFNIPSVVFRQSCIYGERQFGLEDQGWVAWFLIAAAKNERINIFGDGKQVRDLLNIKDLLDAYDLAIEKKEISAGKIYNIGGGINQSISIWEEFSTFLQSITQKDLIVDYNDWRLGDQKVYISDNKKIINELNWQPKIGIEQGIRQLYEWILANISLFK